MIVVGTGRCGTGFMAAMLTRAGIRCGHEEFFTSSGFEPPYSDHSQCADSSWLAVPFLDDFPDATVVLVHRHPVDVIASFLGIRFFEEPSPWLDFWIEHCGGVSPGVPFWSAVGHYIVWNRTALARADHVIDIGAGPGRWEQLGEDLDLPIFDAWVGTPKRLNHRQRIDIDPASIPDEVWDVRQEMLNRG